MKLRLTYSQVFISVLAVFMFSTGTAFGPYSTEFGPYWLVVLLACVGGMLGLRPTEFIGVSLRPASLLGGLFFFALFVAAVFTHEGRVLQLVMPMIAQLLCYFLALWLASRFILSMAFGWVSLLAFFSVAVVNFYDFFIAPQAFSVSPGRAAGFFLNPNNSGAAVSMLAFLALVAAPWRSQWFRSAIMAMAATAVIITFSRGGILIYVFLMALVLIFWRDERRGARRSFLIPLVVMVGFAPLLLGRLATSALGEDAGMRLQSLLTGDVSDTSSTSRFDALFDYLRIFFEKPIFGAKPFGSLYELGGMGPHNAFVALGADFGIFALSVPLLMISLCVLRAKQLHWRGQEALILLGFAAWMFLASMFSHNVFYSSFGALVAGLAMGTLAWGRRLHSSSAPPARMAP